MQLQLAVARDRTGSVVQFVAHGQCRALATGRLQRALLVVDAARIDAQARVAKHLPALVVEGATYLQRQLGIPE
ncbi:hypothetical protein D3C73_1628000 [compost metagenome]